MRVAMETPFLLNATKKREAMSAKRFKAGSIQVLIVIVGKQKLGKDFFFFAFAII
jgi:hypothetical protein